MSDVIPYHRLWKARQEKRAREAAARADILPGTFGISSANYDLWRSARVEPGPPVTFERMTQALADLEARVYYASFDE